MHNALLSLCFLAVSVSAGVVNPVSRCGGVGTPVQLRISECDGRCQFVGGRLYNCEEDFFPSSPAQSLSLMVGVCHLGYCYPVVDAELPGSSVQPGNMYTARYNIVPNDIFAGQTVVVQAYLYNTNSEVVEICLSFEVDMV